MSDSLTSGAQAPEEEGAAREAEAREQAPSKRAAWKRVWQLFLYTASIVGLISASINLNNCRLSRNREKEQQRIESSKFRVLVPLQASSKEYLDFMQMEPGASYDRDGKDGEFSSKVAQNIRDSIKAARETWFGLPNKKLDKDKIDFYFFPEGFDEKSYARAFERSLVEAHLAQRTVIALIGNASSSATTKYGELCGRQYIELSTESKKLLLDRGREKVELSAATEELLYESGKPKTSGVLEAKIPMILPLATATSLTHSLRVDGVPAALRLPPANDRQAKFIAEVLLKAIKPSAIRTIVVKDLSNPVYSEDLLEGFRENYVQHPLAEYEKHKSEYPEQKPPNDFGRILSVISVGGKPGDLSAPFTYPMLTELKPTALVIFGMTNTSLETLAQVKASKLKFDYIILSDGAVDEYLASRIASMVDPDQLKNIYLTFPLPCAMPAALDAILQQKFGQVRKRDFELTHALFVTDSAFVVLSLLEKLAEGGWAKPAKQFVAETVADWRNSAKGSVSKAIVAEFPPANVAGFPPTKRDYMIDHFGNTTNLDYHLYRVEVPKDFGGANHGKSDIGWRHAVEMCPLEVHTRPQENGGLACLE